MIGSMPCSMILPRDEVSDGVILYLHGGGYTCGNLDYAKGFGSALSAKCGVRVLCVAYRLAPEEVYPAALQDATDAYGYLLSNGYAPSRILLCGESAGGGLSYSLCLKLRDKGWALPAGIIAISPWTDLTMSGASYETNLKKDPSMTKEKLKYYADCYLYGAKRSERNLYPVTNENAEEDEKIKRQPLVSPLFADLDRMPPSLIFVGGDERHLLRHCLHLRRKQLQNAQEPLHADQLITVVFNQVQQRMLQLLRAIANKGRTMEGTAAGAQDPLHAEIGRERLWKEL